MFNKILYKTSNGIYLNPTEEKLLLNCLGFKHSPLFFLYIIFNTFFDLALTSIAFGTFGDKIIVLFVLTIIHIPLWIFILVTYFKNNRKTYYETLQAYLKSEYADFEGYSNCYTYVYDRANLLDKNINTDAINFITNGYEFYIYNDQLNETKYFLGDSYKSKFNQSPKLKVIGRKKEKALNFYLKDIESYYICKKKKKITDKEFDPITKVFSKDDISDYVVLKLKSGVIYKFGPKVYSYLKECCPIGEIINE